MFKQYIHESIFLSRFLIILHMLVFLKYRNTACLMGTFKPASGLDVMKSGLGQQCRNAPFNTENFVQNIKMGICRKHTSKMQIIACTVNSNAHF